MLTIQNEVDNEITKFNIINKAAKTIGVSPVDLFIYILVAHNILFLKQLFSFFFDCTFFLSFFFFFDMKKHKIYNYEVRGNPHIKFYQCLWENFTSLQGDLFKLMLIFFILIHHSFLFPTQCWALYVCFWTWS